jgi:hypothetical protein
VRAPSPASHHNITMNLHSLAAGPCSLVMHHLHLLWVALYVQVLWSLALYYTLGKRHQSVLMVPLRNVMHASLPSPYQVSKATWLGAHGACHGCMHVKCLVYLYL